MFPASFAATRGPMTTSQPIIHKLKHMALLRRVFYRAELCVPRSTLYSWDVDVMTSDPGASTESDSKGHILETREQPDKMSLVPDSFAGPRPHRSPSTYPPDSDVREIHAPLQVTTILRFFYPIKMNLTQAQK